MTTARKARVAAYIATGIGSPIVAYLNVKGIIGDPEVILWGAEVAVVSAMAGFKALVPDEVEPEGEHRA